MFPASVKKGEKTSLSPVPMEMCDSPSRRSGRKSTQISTLATDNLLRSPSLASPVLANRNRASPIAANQKDKSPVATKKPASNVANDKDPTTQDKTSDGQLKTKSTQGE